MAVEVMPESANRRAYASSPVAASASTLRAALGGDMGGGAKEREAGGAN